MESYKIKSVILIILDEDTRIINLMIKTSLDIKMMERYFSSNEYKISYEKINQIEDTTKRLFEENKLNSKMHWIFKCIDDGYLDNSLFLNKEKDLIEKKIIKNILYTIIQTVEQFKFYTLDNSYSNKEKNKPRKQKDEHLKTISKFKSLLNDLELGGRVRIHEVQKRYYDINNDKFIDFNINHLRSFLDDLSNEIKEINGNNKKSFSQNYNLGIKYKYHHPKRDGLKIELEKRLKNHVKCSIDNLNSSIDKIIEFTLKE